MNRAGLTLQNYVFASKTSVPEHKYWESKIENPSFNPIFSTKGTFRHSYLSLGTEFFDANTQFCRAKPALFSESTFDIVSATYLESGLNSKPEYQKVLGDDSSKSLRFFSSSASGQSRHHYTSTNVFRVLILAAPKRGGWIVVGTLNSAQGHWPYPCRKYEVELPREISTNQRPVSPIRLTPQLNRPAYSNQGPQLTRKWP